MSSKQGLLGHLDPAGAEAFHILLVEDDELTLKVTEGLLRKCDYQGRDPFRHETLQLFRFFFTRSHCCSHTGTKRSRSVASSPVT